MRAVAGGGAEQHRQPDLVDLKDDGVEIDLPMSDEIDWALKYLKNCRVFA
jgi:hypothetical protein